MSALALTLEASAARRSSSEIIRSRLGEALILSNKSKKLEAEDILHDVATHQSVLEAELAEHRAEIEKLRIGRGELPDDYYCSITCEVMSDPVMAADGYSYERVAIEQWLATGAGTSPKTNERLENEKLLPNKERMT